MKVADVNDKKHVEKLNSDLSFALGDVEGALKNIKMKYIDSADNDLYGAFYKYVALSRFQSMSPAIKVFEYCIKEKGASGEKCAKELVGILEDPLHEDFARSIQHSTVEAVPGLDKEFVKKSLAAGSSCFARYDPETDGDTVIHAYEYYLSFAADKFFRIRVSGEAARYQQESLEPLKAQIKDRSRHFLVYSSRNYAEGIAVAACFAAVIQGANPNLSPQDLVKVIIKEVPNNLVKYALVMEGDDGGFTPVMTDPVEVEDSIINNKDKNRAYVPYILPGSSVMEMGAPFFKPSGAQGADNSPQKAGIIRMGITQYGI